MAYKEKDQKGYEMTQRVVRAIAKQELKEGYSIEELLKYGNEGLDIARRRYNSDRGFKFMSYAVWFIRQNTRTRLAEPKSSEV